jgi:hypothetical protein
MLGWSLCRAAVQKKRNGWATLLHKGKEKGGGGLGWLGNMAQEGFGKFERHFYFLFSFKFNSI